MVDVAGYAGIEINNNKEERNGSKWTEKDVANQFEEAITTLNRLPAVRVQAISIADDTGEIDASEPMPPHSCNP